MNTTTTDNRNLSLNASVNSIQYTTGDRYNVPYHGTGGNNVYDYNYCWHYLQPIVKEYYPVYLNAWQEKNKTEQAFKILTKLTEKKIIKLETIKDFIDTVNTISECL